MIDALKATLATMEDDLQTYQGWQDAAHSAASDLSARGYILTTQNAIEQLEHLIVQAQDQDQAQILQSIQDYIGILDALLEILAEQARTHDGLPSIFLIGAQQASTHRIRERFLQIRFL